MSDITKFYNTIFDPEDETCFAQDAFGTALFQVEAAKPEEPIYKTLQYFSINPMHTSRADRNVVKYRNFLVEFDDITIEEQFKIVASMNMPFTTATYSGNKSVHFIISLEEPLENRALYDFSAKWIYNILGDKVDEKNKNPSRFSRVPGGINAKTDKEQKLLKVRSRVKNSTLERWIEQFPDHMPNTSTTAQQTVALSDEANPALLSGWTRHLLQYGIYEGKRNDQWFKMGFNFIEAGFSLEEALSYVKENADCLGDFSFGEIATCFKSAYGRSVSAPEADGYKSWKR